MEQEETLRQEAIRLHLQGVSVKLIGEQVNRTRQWVYKWLKEFKNGSSDWYKTKSTAPKHIQSKTSGQTRQLVIDIRKRLQNEPYAQKGAISILYEFERLNITPPSISTINRILRHNNLLEQSEVKRLKDTEYPSYFYGVQQMDLVGPKYLKGGSRFYFFNIIDTENHYAGVYPITDKSAKNVCASVIDFWRNYQMPDFLQMDNELSFRGSNRHPRGLGLLMRLALSNSVTPIFIPPAEPWRNGIIEKFNDNVIKYFYNTQQFTSFQHVKERAADFSIFHNTHHRYSSQNNRTPKQLADALTRKAPLAGEIDLNKKILVDSGRIIFIRFIRSDRKLHLLNESFIVSAELVYSYVVAEVIIDRFVLTVSRNNILYHVFNFAMSLP
ncbi:integrase core domain-containing protein [Bacteroides heparinolyticus]|uniref:integrase core domain-containing protein n=1 Tax=Prevotella heparinolytica TaxID=28113 RepID=UPI0035A0C1A5